MLVATVASSVDAEVTTDKIPAMIAGLDLSLRFVAPVFYTPIPNAAVYMNALRVALCGNLMLSKEIGDQGAIQTAILVPALVLTCPLSPSR